MEPSSTKPYLIRAIHEWCVDQGFTPYLAVVVDHRARVPMQYVDNGQIVLNVGLDATQGLNMGNELITFQARFGGVAQNVEVPVDNVAAIYARENGHGMAFEVELPQSPGSAPVDASPEVVQVVSSESDPVEEVEPPVSDAPVQPKVSPPAEKAKPQGGARSHLKIVK